MTKNRELHHLRDENRGLKKRILNTMKASTNNYKGMMYWKLKYHELKYGASAVKKIINGIISD